MKVSSLYLFLLSVRNEIKIEEKPLSPNDMAGGGNSHLRKGSEGPWELIYQEENVQDALPMIRDRHRKEVNARYRRLP